MVIRPTTEEERLVVNLSIVASLTRPLPGAPDTAAAARIRDLDMPSLDQTVPGRTMNVSSDPPALWRTGGMRRTQSTEDSTSACNAGSEVDGRATVEASRGQVQTSLGVDVARRNAPPAMLPCRSDRYQTAERPAS
jgi:hypothetical protein